MLEHELEELESLSRPYLRLADGSYDAGIMQIAGRYARMAILRREEVVKARALSEERRQWIVDFQRARDETNEILVSCVECFGDTTEPVDSPDGHSPDCSVPRLIAQ